MPKKTKKGTNNLATSYPDIAAQWHPTKNGSLTPKDVSYGSGKEVWWQCSKGHAWQAAVRTRTCAKSGCPYCAGSKAITGENDLATTDPDLAAQWHPTKNRSLTPADVKRGSDKKVWWLCPKGHAWQAVIHNRTHGTGCPCCTGRKAIVGTDDLATIRPDLAQQWHPTKNGTLSPSDAKRATKKKVWWCCPKGHEWEASVRARTNGANCPHCSGHKIVAGINDLATLRPNLAAQWHPTKNGFLQPSQLAKSSTKRVWWLGPCGHEWEATVSSRSNGTTGCPYCSGRTPIVGQNDLATTDPDLAAQWHPTMNGTLIPSDIKRGSNRKIWWQCPEGHIWQKSVQTRSRGSGCPMCKTN